MSAAQQGGRDAELAFTALVRRYQRPLYFLCLRYVRDHDAAADLVQRAFIRAFEHLASLRETEGFRSWLFTIGAHLALNHVRDHARFVSAAPDAAAASEPSVPPHGSQRIEADEEAQQVRAAIAGLPPKQRMTLELRIYEELSFRDIATALSITEGAAKVNFHYAVKRLQAELGAAASARDGADGQRGTR